MRRIVATKQTIKLISRFLGFCPDSRNKNRLSDLISLVNLRIDNFSLNQFILKEYSDILENEFFECVKTDSKNSESLYPDLNLDNEYDILYKLETFKFSVEESKLITDIINLRNDFKDRYPGWDSF